MRLTAEERKVPDVLFARCATLNLPNNNIGIIFHVPSPEELQKTCNDG